jgi:hypothetical protein
VRHRRPPSTKNFVTAIGLGLFGAIAGAFGWAAFAIGNGLESAFVAVGVGVLAGFGVRYGAPKCASSSLKMIAGALAIVGVIAAKYMIFAYFAVRIAASRGIEMSYVDVRIRSAFPHMLGSSISFADVAFGILAVYFAYRIPRGIVVKVTEPRTQS